MSSEVENVYQALAAHDMLSGFDPCFVRRKPGTVSGVTHEVWFPGTHFDLGRQRFVPFRTSGGLLEKAAHYACNLFNVLLINIEPTLELSVEPLKWMLNCMHLTDSKCVKWVMSDSAMGGAPMHADALDHRDTVRASDTPGSSASSAALMQCTLHVNSMSCAQHVGPCEADKVR